jgi:hypothetical protein
VCPTTELARESRNLDDANDVAVLLAEEHRRAELPCLIDWRQERMHGPVLEDPLVDDLLDARSLFGSQGLRMREVEPELVGAHSRAGLADMLPEHLLERLVQKMRSCVVRHRRKAHLPRDDSLHAVTPGEALAPEDESLVVPEAECRNELRPLSVPLDPALIGDLPAALGVEG